MNKLFIVIFTFVAAFMLSSSTNAENPDVKIGLNVGDRAPEIIESGVDGQTIKLSDIKGKIVLIDFWASWCGPCRAENPNVVAAYNKYKNQKFEGGKGFTIFSVSYDNNKEKWVNAIEKDKLEWPYHVSDLGGWDSKWSSIFKVYSIPMNFILDENGVILAKNLRGPALTQFLEKIKK